MESINVIGSIEKARGFEVALVATYSSDLSFAERMLFNRLFDNGCRHLSVFVDEAQFSDYLHTQPALSWLGEKYIVHAIRTAAAFHPKMILLLGKSKAKLLLGSGNLTVSGLVGNYEYFSEFDCSSESLEHIAVIRSAYHAFLSMYEIAKTNSASLVAMDKDLIGKLGSFSYLAQEASGSDADFLYHSHHQSLIQQILPQIKDPIIGIDICVPFYDQSLDMLRILAEQIGCREVTLYIQDQTSNFPIAALSSPSFPFDPAIRIFDLIQSSGKAQTHKRYHGKLLRFRSTDRDYLLYGSPNCSTAALARSFEEGGNFETAILRIGDAGQFDHYFSDLQVIGKDQSKLISMPPQTVKDVARPVRLLSAMVIQKSILCSLSMEASTQIVSATIDGVAGELTFDGDQAIARFNLERDHLPGQVFKLIVQTPAQSITLTGWLAIPSELSRHRAEEARQPIGRIGRIEDLEDGSLLVEVLLQCLSEMNLSTDSKQEPKIGAIGASVRPDERTELGGDPNPNPDAYYVDDESEKTAYMERLRHANPISYLASLFMKGIANSANMDFDQAGEPGENRDDEPDEARETGNGDVEAKNPNEACLGIEQYAKRLINRYLRALRSDTYKNRTDFSRHLEHSAIIMGLIWAVREKGLLQKLLKPACVANVLLDIAKSIIESKKLTQLDAEKIPAAVSMLLEAVVLTSIATKDLEDIPASSEAEKAMRRVVNYLDHSGIDFRDNVQRHFAYLERQVARLWPNLSFTPQSLESILDDLYGYKSWPQIEAMLRLSFGDNVRMQYGANEVTFVITLKDAPLGYGLKEYRAACTTMQNTHDKATNFVYLCTGSATHDKVHIKVRGSHERSLITFWRKDGQIQEDTLFAPASSQ